MRYDKLVRDKIPEIIRAKGETAIVHVADDAEYLEKLRAKLREEVEELLADPCAGEVADVLEVLSSVMEAYSLDPAEVMRLKQEKKEARGGFSGRVILEES